MKKIIAIITARAGSKGLPNKNIEIVGDKTLIEHAIDSAAASNLISSVYISTDSEKYEKIAKDAGAMSLGLRKKELSTDSAKTTEVLLDFCNSLGLADDDILVLLQPTSPIRSGELIDNAIMKTLDNGESSVSVAEVDEPHPFKMKAIDNGRLVPFLANTDSELARQLLPKAYQLTGAVYVSSVRSLKERGSLFSENTNPIIQTEFANIDSVNDLDYLRYLLHIKKVIF